jgi:hypothetical protein
VRGSRESLTIGFLLNTKGLVELVVLNVGLDIGVLTNQVFAIFMIMALWYLTTPSRRIHQCCSRNTQEHLPHNTGRVAALDTTRETTQPQAGQTVCRYHLCQSITNHV